MGSGSLGLAGAVAATVYDRPAVTRQEHHGLVADGAARFGAGETGQLRKHGAVAIFVSGQPGFPWRSGGAVGQRSHHAR